MRSIALAVLFAIGCNYQQAPSTMKWSQRAIVVSLVGVLATSLGAAATTKGTKDAFVAADVTFGVAALASVGVYLVADLNDEKPMTEKEKRQDQAWQLTKHARDLARKGKCDSVAKIDPRVKQLDPDFYEVVFLRDVAVARCLGR